MIDTKPPGATRQANRWHRRPEAFGSPLTKREEMILRLVSEGMTNSQIAYACGISPHTVRNHLAEVLSKTGAPNRVRAAVLFDRWQRGK